MKLSIFTAFCQLLVLWLFSAGVCAAPTDGQRLQSAARATAWLVVNQNGDGSWGETTTDQVRATHQGIWALSRYQVRGIPIDRAISWIFNAEANNSDTLARLLLGLSDVSIEAQSLVTQLDAMAYPITVNTGGGVLASSAVWGGQPGFTQTTLDHVYALRAKLATSADVSMVDLQWSILMAYQNSGPTLGDGWGYSWATTNGYRSVYSAIIPTAEVLLAMDHMARVGDNTYWDNSKASSAINWILSQQNVDGSFGANAESDLLATALAVRALAVAINYEGASTPAAWLNARGDAWDYLIGTQSVQGSWNANAFTTAVAMQGILGADSIDPLTVVDTDLDQIPNDIENLIAGLDPTVADSLNLERSNGANYRDKSSLTEIKVELIVGLPDTTVFSSIPGPVTLVGQLPLGLTFDSSTKTMSGTPLRVGRYSVMLTTDVGPNDRYFIPLAIFVVHPSEDLDGDGISSAYESLYGSIFNVFSVDDGNLDSDFDGVNNYNEFLAGSDPTDDTDVPVIITSSPNLLAAVDNLYRYPVTTNHPSSILSIVNGPRGMFLVDRTVYWLPTSSDIGPNYVTLAASESGRQFVPHNFSIEVDYRGDGDVNNDGEINSSDAILLKREALKQNALDPVGFIRGDMYPLAAGDGIINIQDLMLLAKKMNTQVVADTDKDALPDVWEQKYNLDSSSPNAGFNSDTDSLTDYDEFIQGTNPVLSDTDGDGINDDVEVAMMTSPTTTFDYPQSNAPETAWTFANVQFSYPLSSNIPNVTFSLVSAAAGMNISNNMFTWVPSIPQVGTNVVEIMFSNDGAHWVNESFLIHVAHLTGVGGPKIANQAYQFKLESNLTGAQYILISAVSGMSMSGDTIDWTPTHDQLGLHNFTVGVSSDGNAWTYHTYTIEVVLNQ